MKKVLLTATVQSHICQFHRPLVDMLRESGDVEVHVAATGIVVTMVWDTLLVYPQSLHSASQSLS